jgi:hypothetical protein
LSLMSTIYQLEENVKQYADIKDQKDKRIESMQRMRMSNSMTISKYQSS